MKIETIETFVCHNFMFVRITTDTGLQGVGESTFFSYQEAAASIARSLGDQLIGEDPLRVEHHWLRLYRTNSMRGMGIGAAISAIDIALWDIRGKHLQAPVWQLLGGQVRNRVRAMFVLDYGTLDAVLAQARSAVAQGYTALKVLLFERDHHLLPHAEKLKVLVERMAALRDTVGWSIDIGVELHRNMTPGDAAMLCLELEKFRPLFVEDPIVPDSVVAFGKAAERIRLPMAAGERNTTIWEFAEYAALNGVSYLRPDVGIAGGITHMRKICAIGEAYHQGIVPHGVPNGPIAVAAHVQLGFACPNFEALEYRSHNCSPYVDVVDAIYPVVDGHWELPEKPGLGIELNDEGIAGTPIAPRMTNTWLRADGAVAFR